MKPHIFTKQLSLTGFLFLLITGITSLTFAGCSSSKNEAIEDNLSLNDDEDDNKKTYVFYDQGVEWEAKLQNDKIVELYKDGEKIPVNQIIRYEDKIYSEIKKIDKQMSSYGEDMKDFHLDMEDFHDQMQILQEELKNKQFAFNFDHEQFNKEMQKAASEIRRTFESDEFKENMKQLKKDLKDIKVDINMDELNDEIRRAGDSFKDIHVNIDMSELRKELEDVKVELKDMKVHNKFFRKYNKFIDDLKTELENDGIIKNRDEEFGMKFNSEEMRINGKPVPGDLHKKYKKMYEERFGEMHHGMSIRIND